MSPASICCRLLSCRDSRLLLHCAVLVDSAATQPVPDLCVFIDRRMPLPQAMPPTCCGLRMQTSSAQSLHVCVLCRRQSIANNLSKSRMVASSLLRRAVLSRPLAAAMASDQPGLSESRYALSHAMGLTATATYFPSYSRRSRAVSPLRERQRLAFWAVAS